LRVLRDARRRGAAAVRCRLQGAHEPIGTVADGANAGTAPRRAAPHPRSRPGPVRPISALTPHWPSRRPWVGVVLTRARSGQISKPAGVLLHRLTGIIWAKFV